MGFRWISATLAVLFIIGIVTIASANECRICSIPGADSDLSGDVIPPTEAAASLLLQQAIPHNQSLTCTEWDAYAAAASQTEDTFPCLELRSLLERHCCRGLPPLYECDTAVQQALGILGGSYASDIAPITNGTFVNVGVRIQATSVQIVDFGIDGGAVEAELSLTLNWTDPRLAWNSTTGCSSISVLPSKIWVPGVTLKEINSPPLVPSSARLKVLSNGHVIQRRGGIIRLSCLSRARGSSKLCSADFVDAGSGARYHSNGFVLGENFRLPEYKLNDTASAIVGKGEQLQLELNFVPLVSECNICGYNNSSTLVSNATIPVYPKTWLEDFPGTEEWSCTQIDDLLNTVEVADRRCLRGRAYYEEACCDDKRELYPCESSIHDEMVEMHNTITTPDPSPREDDPDFASKDAVDVRLSLDIKHVLGIQIKSNSIQLLASIDLDWYDKRLAWEPFIGGCNRVSYRASLDAEQTEIWVPNLELVNKIEGVNELPEAHASVRYDGRVRWRRTGVIRATCDLSGIERFPYDQTSCYLEFGGTRNPLYDRVNYEAALEEIEYTERLLDESWNFQEYKLEHNKTKVIYRTELLSGYENKIIRIQLYFQRATQYYFLAFVILYILFTYLSFGMFFIDYEAGERLGYGSSILFVVVAQDITLSESTPVTEEALWINQLSFGSKVFMVIAIVESVAVLFLYSKLKLKNSKTVVESTTSSEEIEEMQSFIGNVDSTSRDYADAPEESGLFATVNGSSNGDEIVSEEQSDNKEVGRLRSCCIHMREGILGLASFILGDGMNDDKCETRRRIKQLRMADMASALFFFLAYTIFVLVMRFAVL